MKKTFLLMLTTVVVMTVLLSSCGKSIDNKINETEVTIEQQSEEIKQFISEIVVLNTVFQETYENSRKNALKLLDIVKKEEKIPSEFQANSLKTISKAKQKSDEIKKIAIRFENSSNKNIRALASGCAKLQEYYIKLLEQYYSLILSPNDYLDSETNVEKLKEYTILCTEQNKYMNELFQSITISESLRDKKKDEFQLSESEKSEIEMFLSSVNTSGEDFFIFMTNEALAGNRVAMYITGQCSLLGRGTPINRKSALLFFKMAASLGYAPAIFELSQTYASEERDPLLSLVYLNLTICFGHHEYRENYYQQTELLSKVGGKRVVQEIERIALEKTLKISEAREEQKKLVNTFNPVSTIISRSIVYDDFTYTEEYWKPFFQSEKDWEQFFGIKEQK